MKITRHGRHIPKQVVVFVVVGVVFLCCALFVLYYFADKNQEFDGKPMETEPENTVVFNDEEFVAADVESLLVIGVDKFEEEIKNNDGYRSNEFADFLMLFVFNNNTDSYSVIPINRDTITDVNVLDVVGEKIETKVQQITYAHSYGTEKQSCRNTCEAVSTLLSGVSIDSYMSLTMDAVPILNDFVGGVEVTLLDDFSHVDPKMVKDQTIKLMGEQALTYVRGRGGIGDQTNISRMKRQNQYLDELFGIYIKKAGESDTFMLKLYTEIESMMVTDSSPDDLQDLFAKASEYTFRGICEIEGNSVIGEYMEFYPNRSSLEKIVVDNFFIKK